ncbi:hypothetical protein OROGR_003378 [Orobanche gracilis]
MKVHNMEVTLLLDDWAKVELRAQELDWDDQGKNPNDEFIEYEIPVHLFRNRKPTVSKPEPMVPKPWATLSNILVVLTIYSDYSLGFGSKVSYVIIIVSI